MTRVMFGVAVAAVAAGGALAAVSAATSQATRIYVVVADAKGQPVPGLTTADFFLQIDGKPAELVSAGPAVEPASVLLLTDRLGQTADYRPNDLRTALRTFVDGVRAGNADTTFAITTFDQIVTQVTKFPSSAGEISRAIERMVGSALDAPLVDALADACGTAARSPTGRRIIFLVYGSYRPDRGNPRLDITAERCRASGASLWAIEARATDGRNYPNPARERIVDDTSRLSGGMREYVATATALDALSSLMARLVASQYVLTFGGRTGGPESRLTVGVKRPGVFVMAPTWRPE